MSDLPAAPPSLASTDWALERRFRDLEPSPWANGRGSTTELVSFEESSRLAPSGADRWRLSVASLEAPGPFSRIPGVRRVFVPVGGAVELVVDGEHHRIEPGSAFLFSGDADTELVALSGPCFALNLMTEDPALTLTRGVPSGGRALAFVPLEDGEAGGQLSRFDLLIPAGAGSGAGSARAAWGQAELHSELPRGLAVVWLPGDRHRHPASAR